MTLDEIKKAVSDGRKVHWVNKNYEVICDSIGQWMVRCIINDSYVGLTRSDGVTLVGNECQFYVDK